MTDRTDRWLLLVVALIGVALLIPAVSAHGTNDNNWTDWMDTNVWGGDAPDDVGPYAGPHGGGHYGPHGGGSYGPAATNETRYGGQYGPHHGPHHGWAYGAGDERPANASHYHGGAYVNGSAPARYANGTAYHHGGYANSTYPSAVNGTYYPGDGYESSPYPSDGTRTEGTSDSAWRYSGGPGGCH
ncbi:hypothetical protein [Halapricum desulfuricans]|uniref:Uncharacterized protein n=1 Tax=Halapricum desulfuricans TaxID=2841257 RepID=A0A897NJC5_9EURY|nr:hypothetical protein [Halapricum desulfuricans]QSG14560.1 hypothetical protein HSEST_1025 [Halapricum desulfuricans]